MNGLLAELKRRNVYKVAVGYAVVAWLLIQAASILLPTFEAPPWVMKVFVALAAAGFIIALFFAWAFEMTPEGLKRTENVRPDENIPQWSSRKFAELVITIALIASGLLVFEVWRAHRAQVVNHESEKSIAVLPFADMSQMKDEEYFCDGISEELLDALAKIEGLRVVARTSSFAFKGKNADVGEIAQRLNVGNVLEGSVRREGNRVRVTAQLIDARNGFHIWSETFERELQGVFAMQDEITRAIVEALKVKLALAPPPRARQNTEAYDLYLQGLYLSNFTDEESLRKALEFFQRALDIDPNFARAWTGIAKVWLWLADAYVRPIDAWPKIENAASKALALDPGDAEAHCYFGEWKRIMGGHPDEEEAELNRAIEITPNLAIAHMFLAATHCAKCELSDAVTEIRVAEKLDPISPTLLFFAVPIYAATNQFDAAIAASKRVQVNPNYIYFEPSLAEAYRQKGDYAAAAAIYEQAQQQTHSPSSGLAITYAKMGRSNDARRILNELIDKSRRQYVSGETIAFVYLALGERDETFRWLERACDEHAAGFYTFICCPDYAPLRNDPRFQALLRNVGLDK